MTTRPLTAGAPPERRARRAPRVRTTLAFDGSYTALLLLLTAGIYLDGLSHNLFGPDQSVFSAYHLLFYTSLVAIGLWLFGLVAANVRAGARGVGAVPAGYLPSVVGVLVFGLGGALDLTGHALFGFEADFEALLSPTHLTLFLGWALIALGPIRAAALRARDGEAPGLAALLPGLLAFGAFVNVLAFAGMAFFPTVNNAWMLGDWRLEQEFLGQTLGVLGMVAQSLLLTGAALWLLRNLRLPAGAFTLFFALFALLTAVIEVRFAYLPVLVATGLVADLLYAWWRPSAARPLAQHAFAAALPVALWGLFYAWAFATGALGGVWYTGYIWTGSVVEAGIAGLLLSLVVASGAPRGAAPLAAKEGVR